MKEERGNRLLNSKLGLRTLAGVTVILAGVAFSASASAEECSRETLKKLANTYVEAQKAGKPAMVPLAEKTVYSENDKLREISKGMLSQALTVDFTRSFYDTKQCAAFTEVVAATHPHPYVILTRMEATKKGQVWRMESVVTDEGDWVFGATPYLNFTKAEKWDEIPKDKRDTREALQKAADSYINNWGDPTLPVLHGLPCARLEGRMYVTTARNPADNPCTMGAFPQKLNTGNRRYVIDETVGAVVIFHDFPWIDSGLGPDHPGTPAGQMFRVEGGKNRYIHEVTACTTPGCGRSRPAGAAAPGAGGPGAGGPGAGGPGGPGGPGAGPGVPRPPGAPGAPAVPAVPAVPGGA
jgi:hypothetical protein